MSDTFNYSVGGYKVLYPEKFLWWPGNTEPVADFTCELIIRNAMGLGLRYIPDSIFDAGDPYGLVEEHVKYRELHICSEPKYYEDALRIFEKAICYKELGWYLCMDLNCIDIHEHYHMLLGQSGKLPYELKKIYINKKHNDEGSGFCQKV